MAKKNLSPEAQARLEAKEKFLNKYKKAWLKCTCAAEKLALKREFYSHKGNPYTEHELDVMWVQHIVAQRLL